MQGVLNSQYSFRRGTIACQLRAALSCLVFDKTLMVSTADMAGFSGGTVQTMMSVDADRVVNMFSWMHELWSLPLQIVVALGLLYTQANSSHQSHRSTSPADAHPNADAQHACSGLRQCITACHSSAQLSSCALCMGNHACLRTGGKWRVLMTSVAAM